TGISLFWLYKQPAILRSFRRFATADAESGAGYVKALPAKRGASTADWGLPASLRLHRARHHRDSPRPSSQRNLPLRACRRKFARDVGTRRLGRFFVEARREVSQRPVGTPASKEANTTARSARQAEDEESDCGIESSNRVHPMGEYRHGSVLCAIH